MKEEREIYLESQPLKANGYHAHDLLTLVEPVEDLKVPRVRECNFLPRILPAELRGGNPLVLGQLSEAWGARRLRGFVEIQMGSCHVDWTH